MDFDNYNDISDEEPDSREEAYPLFRQQSLEESLASLYKPPYSRAQSERPAQPAPSFGTQSSLLSTYEEPAPVQQTEEVVEEQTTEGNDLLPATLLAVGGMLLTLGLVLFFFSTDGVVTLEWNAKKWFVYCLASLPVLYMGIRQLRPKHEPS